MCADDQYSALRKLGERGQELERRRGPDPYPRPTGPAPPLDELRRRRGEITEVAVRRSVQTVRVFGSVARGDAGPGSDLDVLVEMGERGGLLEQAAFQADMEDLLGCPVHVMTTTGLKRARDHTRQRIEREAVTL
jgi:predicted nucleotidyltransferase